MNFSPDFTKFVTFGFGDRVLRIFNFKTGKIVRKFDESLQVISEMQQVGTSAHQIENMEFSRRVAIDQEIEKLGGGQMNTLNASIFFNL